MGESERLRPGATTQWGNWDLLAFQPAKALWLTASALCATAIALAGDRFGWWIAGVVALSLGAVARSSFFWVAATFGAHLAAGMTGPPPQTLSDWLLLWVAGLCLLAMHLARTAIELWPPRTEVALRGLSGPLWRILIVVLLSAITAFVTASSTATSGSLPEPWPMVSLAIGLGLTGCLALVVLRRGA